MKLQIEGDYLTKEDLIVIGNFLTGFLKERKDLIKIWILEGTEGMSKEECRDLIGRMFKEEPAYKTLIEIKSKARQCNCDGVYKYMEQGEYEVFSPMFYCMNYEEYAQKMHKKDCPLSEREE